jgi:hypothetical protein
VKVALTGIYLDVDIPTVGEDLDGETLDDIYKK